MPSKPVTPHLPVEQYKPDLTPPEGLPAIPPGRFVDGPLERPGAPSKLTEPYVTALFEGIYEGLPYRPACARAGFTYQTMRNWLTQAEKDIKAGEPSVYVTFAWLLERELARCEFDAVKTWRKHFNADYRAIRDFLERRFPDRWGRTDRLDINAKVIHGVVMLPPLDAPPDSPGIHTGESAIDAEFELLDDPGEQAPLLERDSS